MVSKYLKLLIDFDINLLIYLKHRLYNPPVKNKEGDITTLSAAQTNSLSLRTTVPIWIVKQFGLSEGDKLKWKIEARNNELVLLVQPLKLQ